MDNCDNTVKKYNQLLQRVQHQYAMMDLTSMHNTLDLFHQQFDKIDFTQITSACQTMQQSIKSIMPEVQSAIQNLNITASAINKSFTSVTPQFFKDLSSALEFAHSTTVPRDEITTAVKNLTVTMQNITFDTATAQTFERNEISLNDEVANTTAFCIDNVLSDGETKSTVLSKIREKMSVGDLLSFISLILTILFFAYGQVSSYNEQAETKQQNDKIIHELHDSEIYESKLLDTIQQLTSTANNLLDKYQPPLETKKDFKDKQDNQKIYNSDVDSKPEN